MPDIKVTIPHQLTRDEVKRRIQDRVGSLRTQKSGIFQTLEHDWAGDTMTYSLMALGQSVSGHLVVDDQAVHLVVALPWLLASLAEMLKPRIVQQGRLILG